MADFYLLGNSTRIQMFGAVIKTKNKTIVIDGGSIGDGNQLIDFLSTNCNSHVDAWFFTHPHHDHIGAFYDIQNKPNAIQVEKIYHCFPPLSDLKKYENRWDEEVAIWEYISKLFDGDWKEKVSILRKGDSIQIGNVTIKILRVFNPNIINNFVNNSSLVFRIDSLHKSILILGDLGVEGCEELMGACPLSDLQTDYTQMSHHGQCGCSKEFYQYIQPKACIWPAPEWLWNNDPGDGFNTGPWQTLETREWMQKLGVEKHLIEKDGIQRIEI